MQKPLKIIQNLLLVVFLSACFSNNNNSSDAEKAFKKLYPLIEMNKSFSISVEANGNKPFQYGSDIFMTFENISDKQILFSTESFVTLLVFRDGQWVEVKNNNTYSGNILLMPQGTPLTDNSFCIVRPVLDGLAPVDSENELLRIVIVGEILENDSRTGNFVGAYADIPMSS